MTEKIENPQELPAYDLKIDRFGQWHYQGSPIPRLEMARLFATVLRHDGCFDRQGGTYWLQTPYEKGRIIVEDLPFTAVAVHWQTGDLGEEAVFTTNLGEIIAAGNEHPLCAAFPAKGDIRPAIRVRDHLWARITRPVYYELAARAAEKGNTGLWSRQQFFSLETENPTSR